MVQVLVINETTKQELGSARTKGQVNALLHKEFTAGREKHQFGYFKKGQRLTYEEVIEILPKTK